MSSRKLSRGIAAAVALGALAACVDVVDPALLSDPELSRDLAVSSADAVAQDVAEMIANEAFGGFAPAASPGEGAAPHELTVTRSRTCYDANGVEQAECSRETTASMRIQVTMDGTHQRENFSAIVHRTRNMLVTGLLGQETSRTHNGVGTSNDTTTFSREGRTRKVAESSTDSTVNVVFNLPHETNPWPVSGQIIRNVSAVITVTSGDQSESRTVTRRVVVTFPADAQGNVTIQINDVSCTLNLVTRRVVNCTG